jgi:hypothetical protein
MYLLLWAFSITNSRYGLDINGMNVRLRLSGVRGLETFYKIILMSLVGKIYVEGHIPSSCKILTHRLYLKDQ